MRAPEDPRISALQGGEYVKVAALTKMQAAQTPVG